MACIVITNSSLASLNKYELMMLEQFLKETTEENEKKHKKNGKRENSASSLVIGNKNDNDNDSDSDSENEEEKKNENDDDKSNKKKNLDNVDVKKMNMMLNTDDLEQYLQMHKLYSKIIMLAKYFIFEFWNDVNLLIAV